MNFALRMKVFFEETKSRLISNVETFKITDRKFCLCYFYQFETEKGNVDASDGDRAVFAKMTARAAKQAAVGMEEKVQPDEWDEESAGVEKVDSGKAAKKAALAAIKSAKAEEDRARAMEQVRERQLESCRRCFGSSQMIKHLMIAMGSYVSYSLSSSTFQSFVSKVEIFYSV